MKRNLAYLLVSALLLFSLTACGCTATPQDEATGSGTQEESTQNGDTQNNGSQGNGGQNGSQSGGQGGDSAVIGNGNGSGSGNGSSGNGSSGNGSSGSTQNGTDHSAGQNQSDVGVPFDEMLENGKVEE